MMQSIRAVWRAPCVHLIRLLSFLVAASGSASVIVYVFLGGWSHGSGVRPWAWAFEVVLANLHGPFFFWPLHDDC